jgi:hypothetical protein
MLLALARSNAREAFPVSKAIWKMAQQRGILGDIAKGAIQPVIGLL